VRQAQPVVQVLGVGFCMWLIVWHHWTLLSATSGPMGAWPRLGAFSLILFGLLLRLKTLVRLCLAHRSGNFAAGVGLWGTARLTAAPGAP